MNLRREEGMTMVEVVVAALIVMLGALAVLSLVDTTARTTYRAEQSQVVSNKLQDELERVKDLPYSQIALTSVPAGTGDQASPASRLLGTNYNVAKQGTDFKPLVYNGSALEGGGTVSGGGISPAPSSYTSGDVSGTVHRYVVWENDDSCSESMCPGAQDFKRIIVASTFNPSASGGTRVYQEVQARVANPDAQPVNNPNPIPPGGESPTPWTFFLTDTPCNNSDRQPITGDHSTHNTRGACSSGPRSGNTPGAPDLMFPEAPPANEAQPLYDYATDVEPAQNPSADKGLTIVKLGNLDNCLVNSLLNPVTNILGALIGDLDSTKFQKVHKWVSPPIPSGLNLELFGEGSLDLWTKTVNGANHAGKLCVFLFDRQLNVLGIPVDTPIVSLSGLEIDHFTYSQNPWPSEWTEVHIPINFIADVPLLPGHRLGVAVAVERQGTPSGSGLEFMYDSPSFDSRLTVQTNALLPW